MNADGSACGSLCFDQDLDLHPSVLPNGQVIYSRWDYTGIMHVYLRPLMVMNPDGTLQRAVYGSNSYYPNSLFFPRAIPGQPDQVAAILSGYHGVNRMGELVVLDTAKGWHEADGIMLAWAIAANRSMPVIRDDLVGDSWPKFLHPYPLSDKYFSGRRQPGAEVALGHLPGGRVRQPAAAGGATRSTTSSSRFRSSTRPSRRSSPTAST